MSSNYYEVPRKLAATFPLTCDHGGGRVAITHYLLSVGCEGGAGDGGGSVACEC
jgi:hypothetical protein